MSAPVDQSSASGLEICDMPRRMGEVAVSMVARRAMRSLTKRRRVRQRAISRRALVKMRGRRKARSRASDCSVLQRMILFGCSSQCLLGCSKKSNAGPETTARLIPGLSLMSVFFHFF